MANIFCFIEILARAINCSLISVLNIDYYLLVISMPGHFQTNLKSLSSRAQLEILTCICKIHLKSNLNLKILQNCY